MKGVLFCDTFQNFLIFLFLWFFEIISGDSLLIQPLSRPYTEYLSLSLKEQVQVVDGQMGFLSQQQFQISFLSAGRLPIPFR